MRLPALSALRAFEATARLSSVSLAARELNLTDGAISRAVRELEADLGFALFERANRHIAPTAVALALANDVRHNLEGLSAALSRARNQSRTRREITLSCEPTFLMRWLIPRIASLQDALGSERELRLVSAGGPVDFIRDTIDLAIRRSDFVFDERVVAEPFMSERIGPVCRPDLHPAPDQLDRVRGTLLHTATRPAAWRDWSERSGVPLLASRDIRLEHFYQTLQGAVAGTGIAIGPTALVADDIRSGALVAPWGFVEDGTHYALMRSSLTGEPDTFNAVLDWLRLAVRSIDLP
jgi:LysR family transcriptional regulator, glycine cleavage system transcriptional activator